VSSQFGDEIIIDLVFPRDFLGHAVDVGACDGVYLSNTKYLEDRGWSVLCIEPNPKWHDELKKNRSLVLPVACGPGNLEDQEFTSFEMGQVQGPWAACSSLFPDASVVRKHTTLIKSTETFKVPVRSLEWCLEQVGFTKVDFLTIDTEGYDMEVLKGFDVGRWLPKMIIVENWSGDDRFSSYLSPYGYNMKVRTGVNDIFARI